MNFLGQALVVVGTIFAVLIFVALLYIVIVATIERRANTHKPKHRRDVPLKERINKTRGAKK